MARIAYIQVTRRCNQECRFCSNPAFPRTIRLPQAKRMVDRYIREGYAGLILTGGEPTLYPGLPALIRYAVKKRLPVRLITNGQKLADPAYLASLVRAGLRSVSVSVYSHQPRLQGFLTGNPRSHAKLTEALENLRRSVPAVDVHANIVINRYNADHLEALVRWIEERFGFVRHYVWNNLDPAFNRASRHPDTVPRLVDFELELHRALRFLSARQKTARVERVPLCYMAGFEHLSTEARKIAKGEDRAVFFLDEKGLVQQGTWRYGKAACCRVCRLEALCPGLYRMDEYYSSQDLYPVFEDPEAVRARILGVAGEPAPPGEEPGKR